MRPDAAHSGIDETTAGGHPDGLVVFDGLCNFCSRSVRLLLFADARETLRFTPLQSPYGQTLCALHGVAIDEPSTFLFFEHGRALGMSDAALAVAARLPPPWRWARGLGVLPRPLRDGVYRWIARHRYRLFGKRSQCWIPAPAVRARFLDEQP